MLKLTSIVGYTSCGLTYIESFLTIFGQCINVLNYKNDYMYDYMKGALTPCGNSLPEKKGATIYVELY